MSRPSQLSCIWTGGNTRAGAKAWAKAVSKIDPAKRNGYGIEGEFLRSDANDPETYHVALPAGSYLLLGGRGGSWKNSTTNYALVRATRDGVLDYHAGYQDFEGTGVELVASSRDQVDKQAALDEYPRPGTHGPRSAVPDLRCPPSGRPLRLMSHMLGAGEIQDLTQAIDRLAVAIEHHARASAQALGPAAEPRYTRRPDTDSDLVDEKTMAKILTIPRRTLAYHREQGRLTGCWVKNGRRILWHVDATQETWKRGIG